MHVYDSAHCAQCVKALVEAFNKMKALLDIFFELPRIFVDTFRSNCSQSCMVAAVTSRCRVQARPHIPYRRPCLVLC